MTKTLKCDKPVDLDEARKAKGLPRRKRDDPKATAYELRIRVPTEFQGVMGRKKLSRTVFARNKREELRARIAEFEEDANRMLEDRTTGVGIGAQDVSPLSPATPFGEYVERYIALRSNGAIGRQTLANERRYAEYLREVIGLIPLRDLTAMDVERCLLQVPEISRRWANERVEEWKRKREQAVREGNRRKKKPLGSPRVAGPDMQHKILKFCREILNDALDRELVQKNVAKARFLSKNFKKSRPLIDPLMEEDAARFLHEVKALPLSPFKVACLALFSSGMRPEEALALKMGGVNVGGVPSARITGSLEHGTAEIVEYTKSDSSYRTVPIDDYTSREIGRWIEEKSRRLRAMGIRPGPSTPLVGELDKPLTYNVFKKQWQRFVEKVGFEGVRPYALRHTFATINLARGENIKTISVILGHARRPIRSTSMWATSPRQAGSYPTGTSHGSNRCRRPHSFGTFVFRCVLLGMRYNSSAAFSQRMNCGRRQVVRPRLPKPVPRVRVPSPAPAINEGHRRLSVPFDFSLADVQF